MDRRPRSRGLTQEIARLFQAIATTRSLAYPRVTWRAAWEPRRRPGVLQLPFGRIRYSDAMSLRTTYRQIFVERIYDVAGLGDAPTIVDCGGNIGLSAIAFKRQYPQARVLVFEADPAIAGILTENVKSLGLRDVTVCAAAVAGAEGEIGFQSDGAEGGRVVPQAEAVAASQVATTVIRVPAVRLSDRLDGPVDLLKLDIEGSEYDVIADLCESGRCAQVKRLICEVHGSPATQRRVAELWRRLSDAGFRLSVANARTGGRWSDTPFAAIEGVYYAVMVYAWRP